MLLAPAIPQQDAKYIHRSQDWVSAPWQQKKLHLFSVDFLEFGVALVTPELRVGYPGDS